MKEYGWEFVFVAFGACGVVLAALWAVLGASEPPSALAMRGPTCFVG